MSHVVRAVLVASAACAAVSLYPVSAAHATVAKASKKNPATLREPIIRQMIVKLRNPKATELVQPLGAERVTALSTRAGVAMRGFRAMSHGASVLRLEAPLKYSEAKQVAERLAADPEVAGAWPDRPVRAMAVPPDASFAARQWHFFAPGQIFSDAGTDLGQVPRNFIPVGGANLPGAWDRTQGSSAVVVAVVDTGVTLNHPDLAAALLPGFDFVSSTVGGLPNNFVANDGDGRDIDPSDPGDWITGPEQTNFPDCDDPSVPNDELVSSSWHGTHMTGSIIGQWGNLPTAGTSTAGIAPGARVVPVRALGKCGGVESDVADAITWAAGLSVPNVPNNPTPARIISLSLGSQAGACDGAYSLAVSAVAGQALLIAAAGNDGVISVSVPANCPGVLGVTAHTVNGDSADYANVGPEVGLSSPGGGFPTQLTTGQAVETDNAFYTWGPVLFGATTPGSTDGGTPPRSGPAISGFTGTSGATAIASGVAALVLSARPSLTPAELRNVLVSNVRPHPPGTFCAQGQPGAGLCGSGLLDANAAVSSVSPPPPGDGGGGALPLAQVLLLVLLGLFARQRRF